MALLAKSSISFLFFFFCLRDPRLTLPTQRRRPERDCAEEATVDADDVNVDVELSRSSLWQADIRDQVTASRKAVPDDVINRRRRRLLVPGTALPPHADDCAVPVLIVNAPHEGGDRKRPAVTINLSGWTYFFFRGKTFKMECRRFGSVFPKLGVNYPLGGGVN